VRSSARALLLAAAALLLIGWQLRVASHDGVLFGDFRAFYCGAHAVLTGADPYAAPPLYRCESTPMPYGLMHSRLGIAVPAPLPGYAILAFVPFAALPFVMACGVWLLVLLACVVLAARALAILLGRPADLMLWTFVTAVTSVSIPTGETGAPLFAAVLWMAVALRRGAWPLAALAAGCTMLVPHVGLPAVLGAFLFVPPARKWLIATAAILGAMDVVCGGVHAALSYFTIVLPAHARAEIGSSMQYGVTWMLHSLRASDRAAIAGGELSYVCMAVLGLWTARAYAARRRDAAYAALVPPAFAVFGGTFIHLAQIVVAIPAALLLYMAGGPRMRAVFAAAFLLLACPWLVIFGKPLLIPIYALLCAGLGIGVLDLRPAAALRAAIGAVLVCAAILFAAAHFGAAYAPVHASAQTHGDLAQNSWAAFVGSHWSSTGIAWWIAKAPTWAGLALLTLGCAYGVAKKDFVAPVAIEEVPVVS
jgi:hypothetical protein